MKIYDEISIDMNPESDTYEQVLSEDSCEWSGNVALCGGIINWGKGAEGVDLRTSRGTGRPGISALGLERFGHQMPSSIPHDAPQAGLGISGVFESPTGAATPIPSSMEQVHPDDYSGQKVGRFLGWGRRRSEDYRPEQATDEAFKDWYGDPASTSTDDSYIRSAVTKPLQDIRLQGFQSAEELGLPQDILSQYGAEGGLLPTEGGLTQTMPLISKGGAIDVGNLRHQLEQDILAEQGTQEDLDLQLSEAETAKDLSLRDAARQRTLALRGGVSEHEARQAALANTGMYRSGPAQRTLAESEEAFAGGQAEMASNKREMLRQYGIKKGILEGDKETAASDLEERRRAFGVGVGEVLERSTDDLTGLMSSVQDVAGAHSLFGDYLRDEAVQPHTAGFASQHLPQIKEHGALRGKTGYGAPSGGWFSEARGLPQWMGAKGDVDVATAFKDWIRGLEDPGMLAGNVTAPGEE